MILFNTDREQRRLEQYLKNEELRLNNLDLVKIVQPYGTDARQTIPKTLYTPFPLVDMNNNNNMGISSLTSHWHWMKESFLSRLTSLKSSGKFYSLLAEVSPLSFDSSAAQTDLSPWSACVCAFDHDQFDNYYYDQDQWSDEFWDPIVLGTWATTMLLVVVHLINEPTQYKPIIRCKMNAGIQGRKGTREKRAQTSMQATHRERAVNKAKMSIEGGGPREQQHNNRL